MKEQIEKKEKISDEDVEELIESYKFWGIGKGVTALRELLSLRKQVASMEAAVEWMAKHEASFSWVGPPSLQVRYYGDGYRGKDYYYSDVYTSPLTALIETAALPSPPKQASSEKEESNA